MNLASTAIAIKISILAMLFSVTAEATTFCMIGDSHTANGSAWRQTMQATRSDDWTHIGRYSDGIYLHDGIGGNTTKDVLARIDTIAGCEIAVVLIGGNDLLQGEWTVSIANRIKQIADTIAATGAQVYILTVLPANIGVEANQRIVLLNYRIKTIVTDYPIVDTHMAIAKSGATAEEVFMPDGIHLRWLGNYILGVYVRSQIP